MRIHLEQVDLLGDLFFFCFGQGWQLEFRPQAIDEDFLKGAAGMVKRPFILP